MIPPVPATPAFAPPFSIVHSPIERKTHFLALGIIASVGLLLIVPLEAAFPLIGAALITALFCFITFNPPSSFTPAPVYIKPMQPLVHSRFIPSHNSTPRARAPVGTGAPTRILPPASQRSNTRAPVGTGAPTPILPPTPRGGLSQFARAPVGRR